MGAFFSRPKPKPYDALLNDNIILSSADRKKLIDHYANVFSSVAWSIYAEHKNINEPHYINAELIFANVEIVQKFSDDDIVKIVCDSRPLCQIVMHAETVKNRSEDLQSRLKTLYNELYGREIRGVLPQMVEG